MIQSRDGLIKAIQEEIPIVERPFGEIGKSLDIGEDDVIKAIEKLRILTVRTPKITPLSKNYTGHLVRIVYQGKALKAAYVHLSHPLIPSVKVF